MRIENTYGIGARRLLGVAASLALLAAPAPPAAGQSFEFTGDEGPAWENENNWMPTGVPGQGDNLNASITIPKEDGPVVPDGVADEFFISTITAPGGLTLGNGNTLNVSDSGTISGFTLDGGILEPFAGVTVELENNGVQPSQWNSGSIGNNGEVLILGDLNVTSNPGGTISNSAVLKNEGTIEWLGPPVLENFSETNLGSEAGIVNDGGTMIFGQGGTLDALSSNTFFRNDAGTIDVNAGDPAEDLFALWEPSYEQFGGTLNVNTGQLLVTGSANFFGGQVTIMDGATLSLDTQTGSVTSKFAGLDSINGGGTLELFSSAGSDGFIVFESLTLNVSTIELIDSMEIVGGTQLTNNGSITGPGVDFTGGGTVLNHGAIVVGPVSSLNDSISIKNESEIIIDDSSLDLQDSASLINEPTGSISLEAFGSIGTPAGDETTLVNRGLIEKTEAGQDSGSTVSTIAAYEFLHKDGAEIRVETGELGLASAESVWGDGGGSIVVNEPGELDTFQSTLDVTADHSISGTGTVTHLSPSQFTNTTNVQTGATLELNMTGGGTFIYEGDELTGGGTVVNNGMFEWSGGQIGAEGDSDFGFANNGTMEILGGDLVGGTLANNATVAQTLSTGVIDVADGATITNNGEWTTEGGNITDDGDAGTFTNNGTFTAEGNETVLVSVPFDNQGTVISNASGVQTPGLVFTDVQQLQNGALTGGTWIVAPDAELILEETVDDPLTTIGPGASVTGSTGNISGFPMSQVHTIDGGSLTTNGDTELEGEITTQNGGSLTIEGAEVTAPDGAQNGEADGGIPAIMADMDQDLVIALGEVSEPMLVAPTLDNFGRILPGGEDEPGPFNLTGALTLHEQGVTLVELGGLTPLTDHDQVAVQGDAQLGGTLDVDLLGEFTPQLGDDFVAMTTTGAMTGAFDAIETPDLGENLILRPLIEPAPTNIEGPGGMQLRLVTTVPEDLNGDVGVDGADLGLLLGAWGPCPDSEPCPADLNETGEVDGADLGLLLGAWGGIP